MQRLAQGIMDKTAAGVLPQRVMVSPKATTPQPIVRPEEVVDRPERLHSSDHKQADGIQMGEHNGAQRNEENPDEG